MKHVTTLTPDASRPLEIHPDHRQHPGWTWLWDRLLGPVPATDSLETRAVNGTVDRSAAAVNAPP